LPFRSETFSGKLTYLSEDYQHPLRIQEMILLDDLCEGFILRSERRAEGGFNTKAQCRFV
jgi:hypothetical protein